MKARLKKAKIGIMSFEEYKKRTIAIAKGKYRPKKDEPKIWFNSIKSLASLLSEENQKLLKLIVDTKPQSVSELEKTTGRKANNLLRTLRSMEHYGLVKLIEKKTDKKGRVPLVPKVLYDIANIEIKLTTTY